MIAEVGTIRIALFSTACAEADARSHMQDMQHGNQFDIEPPLDPT